MVHDEARRLPACPFTRSPGREEEGPRSVTTAQVIPRSVTHRTGNSLRASASPS